MLLEGRVSGLLRTNGDEAAYLRSDTQPKVFVDV